MLKEKTINREKKNEEKKVTPDTLNILSMYKE